MFSQKTVYKCPEQDLFIAIPNGKGPKCPSTSECMDIEYPCSEIRLSNKEKQSTDTHNLMDKSQKHVAELKESDAKGCILWHIV